MKALPEKIHLPPKTVSGHGAIGSLADECTVFGNRGILVHGHSLEQRGRSARIVETFSDRSEIRTWCHPGGEPTLEHLNALLGDAKSFAPDWIAAVGGGSVMDVAKAAAGLLQAPLSTREYHDGADLPVANMPFLVAPTTAGTGSEATYVSVLTNLEAGVKKSIRHPSHMARVVFLDPDLLEGCPLHVVAASGMDAFTQAVESYISVGASWFSDGLALEAVRLIHRGLPGVYGREDSKAAEELLLGSYMAGLALSHARLGIVHGLAHPLGCRYHVAHGLACAVLLPPALEFNRETIDAKYHAISQAIGEDLMTLVQRWMDAMDVHSPFSGQPITDREGIVRETMASGSTRANPRTVCETDVEALLDRIFA